MPIVEDYLNLTKQYKSIYGEQTLLLMQVGSFYECYALVSQSGEYIGSNICDFANINDMIISKKNVCVGELNVVMAGFGLPQIEKYVKKMQNSGYTIVVFSQDSQSKNTTRSLSGIYSPGTFFTNSELSCDDNTFDNLSNNTICIWAHINTINKYKQVTFGYSIIDIITGRLVYDEYTTEYSNLPGIYDQLEKTVSIYRPCECIVITNNTQERFIETLISYSNINAKKVHKIILDNKFKNKCCSQVNKYDYSNEMSSIATNCERQKFQETFINKVYGANSYTEHEEFHQHSIAIQSVCFLLDFISRHNPNLVQDIKYPIYENSTNKLVLANHSLIQLNILNDNRFSGKLSSVHNFLNNAITASGKRAFAQALLNPITDCNELNSIYKITQYCIDNKKIDFIRNQLSNIKDFEKIERKAVLKTINPKDFVILLYNLKDIIDLDTTVQNDKNISEFINNYVKADISLYSNKLIEFINSHFNIDKASEIVIDRVQNYSIENLNFISSKHCEKLNLLFKNSLDADEQLKAIKNYLSKLIEDYEKSRVKISKKTKTNLSSNNESSNNESSNNRSSNDESNNYVKVHETNKCDAMLISTRRRSAILKDIIENMIKNGDSDVCIEYTSKYSGTKEYINLDLSLIDYKAHGSSQTNMQIYSKHIDSIAYNIHNSRDILISKITDEYNNILQKFLEINNSTLLNYIAKYIGQLDLLQTRCYNAVKWNYCRPVILKNNGTNKSYVNFEKLRHVLIEHLNQEEIYVTNNLEIGTENTGVLLYGTNAVGKTSFIKSIGISIIMAQSGMFVPCSSFTYYPYNYLFTRILGNDNIFKGLSTFAVEMCELRTILKESTENSIILGDELCSGTESTSALSIFVASLQHLHNINATFLFATHFHEVLDYSEVEQLNKLQTYHMSVIYDREKNCLIYDRKLKLGPGKALYGLEVCKSLDLPSEFIETAYNIRNKYAKNTEFIFQEKPSRYNAKKLTGLCEVCKTNRGNEVHHLQFQRNADKNGIINNEFNKNKKANLINICDMCHDKMHKTNTELKIAKTSNGYQLVEV